MATGTIMPNPVFTGLDAAGDPLSGGKLYTYQAGTTTPATTYSDVGLTTPNANPVVLNSAGRASVFLTPGASYKFLLKTSADVTVWTADNISSVPTSTSSLEVTGTAGEALAERDVVYLADGTGGTTAGRWYRASATATVSSTFARVLGVVTTSLTTGQSGSIRVGGNVAGYAGLTPGAPYYVSGTTPGAITGTAPTYARIVGTADSTTSLTLGPDTPRNASPAYVASTDTGTQTAWAVPVAYVTSYVTWNGASNMTLQGIAAGQPGQLLVVSCATTTAGRTITLTDENASATATNRIRTDYGSASAKSVVLRRGQSAVLCYTASRWYLISVRTEVEYEYDNGNSSTAITIDWTSNGPLQRVTRNGNCTYTLTAPPFPGTNVLKMVHDATATTYTVTFSPTVRWPNGTAFTFTNTANAIDILTFYWDGTNYYVVGQAAFA